jgi:phosphomannomutase
MGGANIEWRASSRNEGWSPGGMVYCLSHMTKHFFFDLDNTLTPSRRPLKKEHVPLFDALCQKADVIVVTGGTKEHIEEQVGPSLDRYFILAQSGNHALDKDGNELWRKQLSPEQVRESLALIEQMRDAFAIKVRDEGDLIDNRGALIGYSVIGYHEGPANKDAFDPDFSRRKEMLTRFPVELARLREVGIEVFPAGSSGFNFTLIGSDKGVNVGRLMTLRDWPKDDCIYVGDALGPGENDHSVVGVIRTHAVTGPDDTFAYISSVLV